MPYSVHHWPLRVIGTTIVPVLGRTVGGTVTLQEQAPPGAATSSRSMGG